MAIMAPNQLEPVFKKLWSFLFVKEPESITNIRFSLSGDAVLTFPADVMVCDGLNMNLCPYMLMF